MEQAGCHVKMLMALFQSGLMDNLSTNAKLKCSRVSCNLVLQDFAAALKDAYSYRNC